MSEQRSNAGGSAQAEFERRLARNKTERRRRRPMILALAAGLVIVGFLNAASNPIAAWVLVLGSIVTLSGLFVTPSHVTAWRIGADGEMRTARLLEPLIDEGFAILHDRKIPGSPSANIDHIVIGPPGIFIVETKSFSGSLKIRNGEIYVAGRRKTAMLEEARREALAVQVALADEIEAGGYRVTPVICVHRADLPWFRSEVGGIRIVSGRELVKRLRKAEGVLSSEEVERLADLADARLKPAVAPQS